MNTRALWLITAFGGRLPADSVLTATKLNRDAAIKVLPEAFAIDAEQGF